MDEDQFYPPAVKFMVEKDNLTIGFRNGSQYNNLSGFPYTPAIRIDTRYGYPTNTPLTTKAGFEEWQISERYCCGVDDLPDGYSLTDVTGKWALKALQRLATNKTQPFVLSVHFLSPVSASDLRLQEQLSPRIGCWCSDSSHKNCFFSFALQHPPVIAPPEYFSYYFDQRNKLPVPISMKDAMLNSAYKKYGSRRLIEKLGIKYPFNDKSKMAELTAAYYAMIEEVDEWVGRLIEVVDQMQIRENTMIIFTADHGEMLGAHGLVEKQVLLEEAARVPLIISFPGNSSMGTTIRQPVSHLDLHSTILDCLGVGDLDESSGASLRRFVDGLSYNKEFDESIVVAEADYRIPLKENKFDRKLGTYPNFMIRKGKYWFV